MPNPDSLNNVMSLMVDDWTNQWYHQKNKEDRIALLTEIRSFLTARRLSEVDKNPELSTLKTKRQNTAAKLEQLNKTISSLRAELTAWDSRIKHIEKEESEQEDRKLDAAKEKARAQRKNRLFSQVVGK